MLRLDLPTVCWAVDFADDLALIVERDSGQDLVFAGNEALARIGHWMNENYLNLAPHITEAMILKANQKRDGVYFTLAGTTVRSLKYLGIHLDNNWKADRTIASLSQLMPNMNEPTIKKRRVL